MSPQLPTLHGWLLIGSHLPHLTGALHGALRAPEPLRSLLASATNWLVRNT
jgi:hypothetical protein